MIRRVAHVYASFARYSGFPANASDGFVGNPKMHELNVGYVRARLTLLFKAKHGHRADSINQIVFLFVCGRQGSLETNLVSMHGN